MDEPFLYKRAEPMTWTFGQVVELVRDLEELGCLNELVAEADRTGIVLSVPPEAVNHVKRYLFQHHHHKTSEKAKGLIRSAACGPRPPSGPPVFPPPGPGDPPPHM